MDSQQITTPDRFQYWLASMDDFLEAFLGELPAETRRLLDYSPASLDVLEAWLLQKYPETQAMLIPDEAQTVNALACYIGETIRKARGGQWTIRLDDPKFAYHGLPILVGAPGQTTPRCPLTLATTAANRRTGHFLRSYIEDLLKQ